MIRSIRLFLNTEKPYAWLLVISLFLMAGISLFSVSEAPVTSPAVERFKAAEEELKDTKVSDAFETILAERPLVGGLIIGTALGLFVFFIGGCFVGLWAIVRLMKREQIIKRVIVDEPVPWGVGDVSKVIILFVFISLVVSISGGLVLNYMPNAENSFLVGHTFVLDLVVLGLVFMIVQKRYGSPLRALGLMRTHLRKDMGLAITSYSVVLPIVFSVIIVLGIIAEMIHYDPPAHPLVDIFIAEDGENPLLIYLSVFFACTIGPFIEEVFFRGFCYNALKKTCGVWGAMILTSVFFAFVHESSFAFIPVFVLGFALVYLYEKRGSLIPSITLHVIHNSLFIGYFFVIKRLFIDTV